MVKRCFQTTTNVYQCDGIRRVGRRVLGGSTGRKVDQCVGWNAGNRLAKRKQETGDHRQKHRERQHNVEVSRG